MRKLTRWLYLVGVGVLLAGCFTPDMGDEIGINRDEKPNVALSADINPSVAGTDMVLPKHATGRLATRSLVDQESTVKLQANFLRIDEDRSSTEQGKGLYTFSSGDGRFDGAVNWEQSYLVEATLMSSPDNSVDRLRSVFLDPAQSYNIRVQTTDLGGGNILKDTTDFYHTRMVGWHPMNSKVPRNDKGTAATVKFNESYYDAVRITEMKDIDGDGTEEEVVAIKFSGLDGKTDVMVSDMSEGQHWHFNDGVHRSDFLPSDVAMTGESIYAPPFGHFEQEGIEGVQREIKYRNFFQFKHYLSAVRLFAYANQSQQNLTMWGDLESVVVADQPSSMKVWLPSEEGVWGEAYDWDDFKNIRTIGTPIYGDNDTSGDMPEEVTFPVSIKGTSSSEEQYLGYALIRPNHDLTVQVTTTSGVYAVTIPKTYVYTKGGVEYSDEIFQAGCIYNIHLSLETSGTIAALLQKDADDVFYDLTRLETYVSPEDEGDVVLETYKYANCYICSPQQTTYLDKEGVEQHYDGYCFSATTIGNGVAGIISQGAETLYPADADIKPHSARLLWESSLGLVSQVELLYGYVRFKTPEDKSRKGNAVIAVYDEEDNILWSWHIWITDKPADQVYENGEHDIIIMDRNLGAMAATWTDAEDALDTYGLYYQWGRKDPSMGPKSYNYYPINLITAPYYDYSSRMRNAAEVVMLPQPTMKDGVENPMFLILPTSKSGGYNYDWLFNRNDFLWGYDAHKGTMSKTIYDPCPWGYRVPLDEIETIFASGGGSTFDAVNTGSFGQTLTDAKGTKFWFPYAGYKGVDKSLNSLVLAWKYVGEKGDYMSATSSTSAGNYQYHRSRVYLSRVQSWNETPELPYNSTITTDYTNRRTAASVRCVKNDLMGSIELRLIPSTMYYNPGDNLTLTMEARAAESCITYALLTVTSNDTGVTRKVYESNITDNAPTWNLVEDYVISTGGEFWSESYTFAFTVENDLGARKTNKVTIYHHPDDLHMDITPWKAADVADVEATIAKTSLFTNKEYTRQFVVTTAEPEKEPNDVTVTYTDGGANEVIYPTRISSVDGNHTYEFTFSVATAGKVEFRVSATCPNNVGYVHVVTQTHTQRFAAANEITKSLWPEAGDGWAGYKWFYWDTDDMTFDWSAESPNGNLTNVRIRYDYSNTNKTVFSTNPALPSANGQFVFTSEEYVSKDADGVFDVILDVTDVAGKTASQNHTCYVYNTPVFEGWDGDKTPNTNFTVSVIVRGGDAPTGVRISINGTEYTLTKDNSYNDTSGSSRRTKTKWSTTLNLAEGTYDNNTVTLTIQGAATLTADAPTIVVANQGGGGAPAVTLTASSTTELFYGDKVQGSLVADLTSGDKNSITNVTVYANGVQIYTANSWVDGDLDNLLELGGFKGGNSVIYRIEATNASGTANAETTVTTVYKVTKQTASFNLASVQGKSLLFENQAHTNTYLADGGNNIVAQGTISSAALMVATDSGNTTYPFAFCAKAGGDNYIAGTSGTPTCNKKQNNAGAYGISYYNGHYIRSTSNRYWKQTSNTAITMNSGFTGNYLWNVYVVTAE